MKRQYWMNAFFIVVLFIVNAVRAQENKLTNEFKSATIERISELVNDNYVFPDVAKATGEHLVKKLKEGRFTADTTAMAFSKSLT